MQGSAETETEVSESKTYDGVAVEFCHEHASQNANGYFTIWVKATVQIGSTTYYTNSASGLSTSGPSEESAIRSNYGGCGITSPLIQPITLAPDSTVNIVLYGDPNGVVFGTDVKPTNNASCSEGTNAFLCSEFLSVFGTVDTGTPAIERYQLVTEKYGKGLMTILFNTTDVAFGSTIRPIYANAPGDSFMNMNITDVETKADGKISFKGYNGNTEENIISDFQRKAHTGSIKFPDGSYDYTATKL